ncbi:MAG: hypothetical protein A2Y77_00775 [Planctomycetes bacterium RBG_13_62_9]|nr:MAG: hypothetical protein A2Y77_00775 [Planctomycetes bacterium RBG_13_62_9]
MNLDAFHFTSRPRLEKPSVIVGWTGDIGSVSSGVVDFLADASGGGSFCQLDPVDFFAVGGVTVEDDVAQYPQSRFSCDERRNLMILRSDEPQVHKYEFLGSVFDLVKYYGGTDGLYTVNGIASMIPHTAGRRVFLVCNDPVMQHELRQFVSAGLTWQGPPHTSTFLLWLAKDRQLTGAGLWVEVPFYLANYEDARAVGTGVSSIGRILGRSYDLDELDRRIADQDETLAQLRGEDPEIDAKIYALEQGEMLNRDEQQELAEAVQDALREHSR